MSYSHMLQCEHPRPFGVVTPLCFGITHLEQLHMLAGLLLHARGDTGSSWFGPLRLRDRNRELQVLRDKNGGSSNISITSAFLVF